MESYQKSNVPFQQKADQNDPPIEIGIILSLVISKIQVSFQNHSSMSHYSLINFVLNMAHHAMQNKSFKISVQFVIN